MEGIFFYNQSNINNNVFGSEMAPTVTAEQNRKYEKQVLKTAKINQNYPK